MITSFVKLKQGFRYEDKHGNRIPVSHAKPYLTMYIPPAYHNVKINRNQVKFSTHRL